MPASSMVRSRDSKRPCPFSGPCHSTPRALTREWMMPAGKGPRSGRKAKPARRARAKAASRRNSPSPIPLGTSAYTAATPSSRAAVTCDQTRRWEQRTNTRRCARTPSSQAAIGESQPLTSTATTVPTCDGAASRDSPSLVNPQPAGPSRPTILPGVSKSGRELPVGRSVCRSICCVLGATPPSSRVDILSNICSIATPLSPAIPDQIRSSRSPIPG